MSISALIAEHGKAASHLRPTATKDSSGGYTKTFATIATGIPCWKQPATALVQERYARLELTVDSTLYFDADVGYQDGDAFTLPDTPSGRVLKVHGYRGADAGLEVMWRADVEEQPA